MSSGWNPFKDNTDRRLCAIEESLDRLHQDIGHRLVVIEQKLTQIGVVMATQADVDALTSAVDTLVGNLSADDSALQTSIAAVAQAIADLENQNPDVDLSALQTSVSNAQAAVDQIGTDAANVAALVPPATS